MSDPQLPGPGDALAAPASDTGSAPAPDQAASPPATSASSVAASSVTVRAYAFASTFRLRELTPVFRDAGAEIRPGSAPWGEARRPAASPPTVSVGAVGQVGGPGQVGVSGSIGARPATGAPGRRAPLRAGPPALTDSSAAEGYTLDELTAVFPGGAIAIAFDFGGVVFFGGDEPLRERLISALARRVNETQPPRTEDFLVEIVDVARPEVRFDRVIVPALSAPVQQVIALLLAQSAAMDYYEEDVQEILDRTERITGELVGSGRLRGKVRSLVSFIGSCIRTKNDIVETLALFDKPEATWEDEAVDRLFVRLREMLEIADRFRALEYRLQTIQDSLVLLVNLSRQESTYRLEVLVVALILLEVVVMVWQIFAGRH